MLTKAFSLDVKELTDAGTFTGYASVYGNVDSYGDIVAPGAFTKTIAENGGEIVILHQHDREQPIGLGKLTDSDVGLVMAGELNLDLQIAREAYSNVKKRILKGLSIGYRVRREEYDREKEITTLMDIDLKEVSLVTFPANTLARVIGVKSRAEIQTIRDYEQFLRDAGGFSKSEAVALASHGFKAIEQRDADDTDLAAFLSAQINEFKGLLK